jgi:DNA-binding response OmpR family regulator
LSTIVLLTNAREPCADILPSLSLLPHTLRVAPASADQAVPGKPAPDVVLIDARRDLAQGRKLLRTLRAIVGQLPVVVVVSDGGWAAVSADWGADDFILASAGPAEVEARLRLALGRSAPTAEPPNEIRAGGLVVNEVKYSARIHGRTLDLTFKEFELLKFLAQSPGRVFTRAQLLQEVWGYDYFGGTRTVDVHVRRLRAKLGADNEELIGTVRNVGYRFVPVRASAEPEAAASNGQADGRGGSPGTLPTRRHAAHEPPGQPGLGGSSEGPAAAVHVDR